jgi:D-sedoheptulose 7-phosphate isomerase
MNFGDYLEQNYSAMKMINVQDVNEILKDLSPLRFNDNTLWVVGNGGSAATASHFVADLNKTILSGGNAIKTIAISEMISLTSAYSNDISFDHSYSEVLKNFAKPGDLLLILSVSGKSPNLVKCAEIAKIIGVRTISIVGRNGLKLLSQSNSGVLIDSTDYQIVENIHVIIMHWIAKHFMTHE